MRVAVLVVPENIRFPVTIPEPPLIFHEFDLLAESCLIVTSPFTVKVGFDAPCVKKLGLF